MQITKIQLEGVHGRNAIIERGPQQVTISLGEDGRYDEVVLDQNALRSDAEVATWPTAMRVQQWLDRVRGTNSDVYSVHELLKQVSPI
jgi:hypothetical protein